MPEFCRAVRPDDSDRQIDESLRRVYEMHLFEQVPDRFRALLDQLRQQQAAA